MKRSKTNLSKFSTSKNQTIKYKFNVLYEFIGKNFFVSSEEGPMIH